MNAQMAPRFIYLVQAAAGNPYPGLAAGHRDVLILNWGQATADPDTLYCPATSWNEGRNLLLSAARRRESEKGVSYRYYIFMDEDCELELDRTLARRLGHGVPDDPFEAFEAFLLKWEPAVGYPRYDWHHTEAGREVNLGYNFDALMNAFHRDTVGTLLPYYTGFDAESWLYSQLLVAHLCAMLYNDHRIQYNPVRVRNRSRRSYDIRKKYWEIPTTFLLNALQSEIGRRMRVENPNAAAPTGGSPRKKDRGYDAGAVRLGFHFDLEHPFFRYRYIPSFGGAVSRPSPVRRTAVCMSGRCVGLDRIVGNLRENLFSVIGPYDLFIYAPDAPESEAALLLNPTVLQVEPDRPIPEGPLVQGVNCRFKTGVQHYLQQLYGIKRANDLRLTHEHVHGIGYDRVIRCRPDLFFLHPLAGIDELGPRYVHVPDFHGFEGVNDRFAVGAAVQMDIYMRQIDTIFTQATEWAARNPKAPPVSAEMCTAGHLRRHGVPIRQFKVRFNRVRPGGIVEDTTL